MREKLAKRGYDEAAIEAEILRVDEVDRVTKIQDRGYLTEDRVAALEKDVKLVGQAESAVLDDVEELKARLATLELQNGRIEDMVAELVQRKREEEAS